MASLPCSPWISCDRNDVQHLRTRDGSNKNDVWVGLFVLIGAAALVFLGAAGRQTADASLPPTYQLAAKFDNIGGLKPAPRSSARAWWSAVWNHHVRRQVVQARVTLALENRYQFPKDSSLKILTSGLLGEHTWASKPARMKSRWPLAILTTTQSAVVLENLIGQSCTTRGGRADSSDQQNESLPAPRCTVPSPPRSRRLLLDCRAAPPRRRTGAP